MSSPACCVHCVEVSLSGGKTADPLICEKTGQIIGWGSSCADFAGRYPVRSELAARSGGEEKSAARSEVRARTADFSAALASENSKNSDSQYTRVHARSRALGKAIPSLPLDGGVSE